MTTELKKRFDAIVDEYVDALLKMWGDSYSKEYGYWVGEDKTGIYCYGDEIFINLNDLIYCVEHGVSDTLYLEWMNYCTDVMEFTTSTPNLKSWCMGCPRIPKEDIEHFKKEKTRIQKMADDINEGKFLPF